MQRRGTARTGAMRRARDMHHATHLTVVTTSALATLLACPAIAVGHYPVRHNAGVAGVTHVRPDQNPPPFCTCYVLKPQLGTVDPGCLVQPARAARGRTCIVPRSIGFLMMS